MLQFLGRTLSRRWLTLGERRASLTKYHSTNESFKAVVPHGDSNTLNFTKNEDGYVVAFTDGACKANGTLAAKAGIGVWFGEQHPMNISEPIRGLRHTNNSAEIQAAERAILVAKRAGITKLQLNTDSQFLINCMTKWIHLWRRSNWKLSSGKPVKNREELEMLFAAARGIRIDWSYVPAHSGLHGNIEADRLAAEGSQK